MKIELNRKLDYSGGILKNILLIAITGILFTIVIRNYYTNLEGIESFKENIEIRDRIVYLDEVLTMSALMFAETANSSWQSRYHLSEKKLYSELEKLKFSDPSNIPRNLILKIASTNARLIKMEYHAFNLVQSHQMEAAISILNSEEYKLQKSIYKKNTNQLSSDLKEFEEAIQADRKKAEVVQLVFIGIYIVILLIGLFYLMKVSNKTKTSLEQNIKERTAALSKANSLYGFLSRINQMILHTTTEQSIFKEACNIAIKDGKFKMAWIGKVDEETDQFVTLFHSGDELGYLSKMKSPLMKDEVLKQISPVFTALRENKSIICNDCKNDLEMAPYNQLAISHGYGSWMILPICKFDTVTAIMTLYAAEPNFFDTQVTDSLNEAIGDISFALEKFEREVQRNTAANEQLKSEANFQTICQNINSGLLLLDNNFNIVAFNQQLQLFAEKYFGFEITENANLMDLFLPEKQHEYNNIFNYVLNGQTINFETSYPTINGNIKMYNAKCNPVKSSDGAITGICLVVEEITERNKLLAHLKESDDQFHSLFNNARDPIFLLDKNQHIINCNEAMIEILGAESREQVINRTPASFSPEYQPDGRLSSEKLKEVVENAFSKGSTQFDWTHKRLNDTVFPVDVSLTLIPMDFTNILLVHWRDITERTETERVLKQFETRFKEAQTLAHLGHWELNFETGVSIWSDETCCIYGLPIEENIQTHGSWISFIHPDDLDYVMTVINKANETLGDSIMEHRIVLRNGTVKHIHAISRFEFDSNGNPFGLYGVTHDITDRKIKDELILQNNAKLKKTNEELDRFVYHTSHDLRAPLKSMLGLSDLIIDDLEPDNFELLERMDMMKNSVIRLDNFIEDILNYSKNTRTEVAKDEIIFSHIIQEIRANHLFMEGAGNVTLELEINQEHKFISDKRRINVLVSNLISNSIKYRDKEKERSFVKITFYSDGINNTIEILDNGIGIADKDKEKIFDMFYRATNIASGSGLGLYIVKETIEKLNGSIIMETKLGKGTKFTITIPN